MKTLKETLLSGGYDSALKEVYLYEDRLAQQRKRYADVIVPEGGFNAVALDMVIDRIRAEIAKK